MQGLRSDRAQLGRTQHRLLSTRKGARGESAAADREDEFRRSATGRVGRLKIQSVSEDLIKAWASNPNSSLAPRPRFRPLRVEGLEYAELAGSDTYTDPTGKFGLAGHNATYLKFRGSLVTDMDRGPLTLPISGRLALDRTHWVLVALEIGQPP
jgi:hypothetical protein